MPKIVPLLTALQIKRLGPGLHAVGGVPGLKLKVGEAGARSWVLRTTLRGRRIDRGLGSEAFVSLAEARDAAREYVKALRRGEDPRAKSTGMTFKTAMSETLKAKRVGWSARHIQNWKSTLERYALPILGNMDVKDIEPRHVVQVLEPHWATKHPNMLKLRRWIENILDFATAKGMRSGDNPAQMKILSLLLPRIQHRTNHHAALPWSQLPDAMKQLSELPGVTPIALRFLILTAARSMEVRGMPRNVEIDRKAALWTLPAARAKSGRPHEVPLPPQALALLDELPDWNEPLMFPGSKVGVPMSDLTFNRQLRLIGIPCEVATAHGFRSTFRDWAGDNGHDEAVAEAALQHARGDATERAYARSTFLARRRELMEKWADFACSKMTHVQLKAAE